MKDRFITKKISALILIVVMIVSISGFARTSDFNSAETYLESQVSAYVDSVSFKNNMIKHCNLEDVITTITFSEYLTFPEFEDFVAKYDIQIVQLQLRGVTESGDRVSIFTRTDKGLAITEEIVNIQAAGEFELKGITGVYALVNSEKIAGLEQDSHTYCVDTSGDHYFELLAHASPMKLDNLDIVNCASRNDLANSSIGELFPKSITWQIEDLGLL